MPGLPQTPSAPSPETEASPAAALPGATPAAPAGKENVVQAGMINFQKATLDQVLEVYAQLRNRTILRPANLNSAPIDLTTQTDLTPEEAVQALTAVLAMNGVTVVDVGDKFVKAVPVAQASQAVPPINFTNNAAAMPELGQYVTHVVQLKYVKPSEMVQVLQPFSNAQNGIQAVDSSQILVLRDYAENVKRMLQMVSKVDVAVPSEYVSEVIPIKYAKATEIQQALSSLSEGGGGTTIGASGRGGATQTGGAMGFNQQQRYGSGAGGYGSSYGGGYGNSTYNRYSVQSYTPQSTSAEPYTPQSTAGEFTPQANSPTGMAAPANNTFAQRLKSIIKELGRHRRSNADSG